jgi:hypothetical protein
VFGPKLQNSAKQLVFGSDNMSTVGGIHRGKLGIFDMLHAIRMVEPKVLEYENVSLWNIGSNLNFMGDVI